MTRRTRWHRSSPWIGLLGGLLIGVSYQLDLDREWGWWVETLGIAALAVVGFTTGLLARWVERRYVYTDV